jgi:DNA-binding CsgD family transcriptional regulator
MMVGAGGLDRTASGMDRLTPRERDCLRLVDEHLSSKEIARRLGLSKHTVDWHLDKARRRLGAADRYEAATSRKEQPVPLPTDSQKDAIDQALGLRRDTLNFHQTWPTLNSQDEQVPGFTWTELERQLSSLAATTQSALMASDLVSATRKHASFKPPEMVLREILCVAGALMDESFLSPLRPDLGRSEIGEAPMT